MQTLLLVIHVMIALALIGVVLIQRSEGGGLGIGGGGQGQFMSGRGTANLLTRATAILAALFMLTSVVLVVLEGQGAQRGSVLQSTTTTGIPALPPTPSPTPQFPTTPAFPNTPVPGPAFQTNPAPGAPQANPATAPGATPGAPPVPLAP